MRQLQYLSGQYRTHRTDRSPKVTEALAAYADLAKQALLRVYPSQRDFSAELCVLEHADRLELFWSLLNLGGAAPGGWHQVCDLVVVLTRETDGEQRRLPLVEHIAGFDAWYRMRGGMIPVLPCSFYFHLEAGTWRVSLEGILQNVQALCLFADAFADLFHYEEIKRYYNRIRSEMLANKFVTEEDPAPALPFSIACGTLSLGQDKLGLIRHEQADRLHHEAVYFSDVAHVEPPRVRVPEATPLDPITLFRKPLYQLHEQSLTLNYCPFNTVNDWKQTPDLKRTHFVMNERTAFFHLEALVPLYLATGDPQVYRTARKWYESIVRNMWPMPSGGPSLSCNRTVLGSALNSGCVGDALSTFAQIDGKPHWVAPLREGLRDWPMHPLLPRPIMDQDAWGNEEMNTTGTFNQCTHFALACWRVGHLLNDEALKEKAEGILTKYVFPGEVNGIWPYRPGNFPSHHYDMYLKWQLSRLLMTGAARWTQDADFVARMRRAIDASLRNYARLEKEALVFTDWTHKSEATQPANAAAHAASQMEALLAMVLYVDEGYLEPLEQVLRGLYRLLLLPEVERCWQGCWFHIHGSLLNLAQHGFHVEGSNPNEARLVRHSSAL